jgi:dipeptidyl aminopeptidase/acylaminoacyl peptidase
VYDEAGQSRLALLDQRAAQEKILPRLPGTLISALRFDRAGARLALNIENAIAPADIYVLDVASNALVRWTESAAGPLGPAQLSAPQAFRYRTWDRERSGRQREFAGLLYRPQAPRAAGAGKLPVLIWLPGGDGEVRSGLIDEIVHELPVERLLFEAPQKGQQAWFIRQFGSEVNLGNIPPEELIPLETLRLGLRSDTMAEILLAPRGVRS